MAEANPLTELSFYMNYPICGFCMTAWDIIYQRLRSITPPAHWVGQWCIVGGCDAEVWDFIDEGTGWPIGWVLGPNGPEWKKMPKPPMAENECFHRRDRNDDNAPWRKFGARLLKQAQLKAEKRREGVAVEDIKWDVDDEDDNAEEPVLVPDDDIEW